MHNERGYGSYGSGMFVIIKGTLAALAFALVSVIIFANVLAATALPDSVIYPINQTLKALSVAIGATLFVKGEKGWLKGAAVGGLFTAFAYPAFSALCGNFSLSAWFVVEALTALAVGSVGGIVAVNVRR